MSMEHRLSLIKKSMRSIRKTQKVGSDCDMVFWYHRKIMQLILGRYCRDLYFGLFQLG